MKLRVIGWSPSRVAKYEECPSKVLYEDLMKMCPVCFKGKVSGGFDGEPVVCDTCSKPQPERAPLERGNRLDTALTRTLESRTNLSDEAHVESLTEATRHPKIMKLVLTLQKAKAKDPDTVLPQESIVMDSKWSRVGQYTKGAWARLKLDVLHIKAKVGQIIDWKSGNIDKRTQQIRERGEYAQSMRAYQISVLSVYPQLTEARAVMAFLDAPPKVPEPFKEVEPLKRKDLSKAQKDWEKKISPMYADDTFSPRPGMYCNWCSFSKERGGPCKF